MNSSVPPQSHEYGGDEVNAIVLDPGSSTIRAGFAGEDIPKSVVPSHYGYLASANTSIPDTGDNTNGTSVADQYLFGDNKLHLPRADVEVKTPFDADGLVDDWDVAGKLFEYTITSRLTGKAPGDASKNGLNDSTADAVNGHGSGTNGSGKGEKNGNADADGDVKMGDGNDDGVEPEANGDKDDDAAREKAKAIEATEDLEKPLAEHPLLMTEPSWNTAKNREKAIEVALEDWGAPAFFLAKTGSLAAFSQGRPTALVIDVGASTTSVTPVFDGFVLQKGVQKSRLAGNFISDQLRLQFAQMTPQVPLTPHYMVKSKQPVDAAQPANAVYTTFDKGAPTDSFRALQEERVLTSFKESMVQVWQGPGSLDAPAGSAVPGSAVPGGPVGMTQPSNLDIARSQPPRPFEFPDGWNQIFGVERYRVVEGLFDSNAALKDPKTPSSEDRAKSTIPALVTASLNAVDVEIRPALLANIVLTGGGSLIDKLAERIQSEFAALFPNPRVKVLATGMSTDRKYGAWVGGSILASLGTFHQMWISRKEYEEHGAGIVEKRCK